MEEAERERERGTLPSKMKERMYSMELVNWLVGLKTSVTMDASSQYEISSWFLKVIIKAFKEK
jgi:hypothetical protein